MPSSEAQLRIKQLDNWFQNKRHHLTCNEIITKLGISIRQFRKDIEFMKEHYDAPICSPERSQGYVYYYEDPDFSIYKQLNDENIEIIKNSIMTLQSFGGLPQDDLIYEISKNLIPGKSLTDMQEQFVFYEENLNHENKKHYARIFTAIQYKEVIKVVYKPFMEAQPKTYTIHPYILKQYNTRWYLFGKCEGANFFPMNLALDRIDTIHKSNKPYIPNTTIDFKEYFEDLIGVTKPNEQVPCDVILHFNESTGKYIESKPIHESQHGHWQNSVFQVKLHVIINYELEKLILSYAESVKVISPKLLELRIKSRIQEALTQY